MIGSGIFMVSADMARLLGPGLAAGGLGPHGGADAPAALSYGELAAMMPRAGGQYVYLREAFSPIWGFLYGWTLFLVIQTGTIAAVAVGFARYSRRAFPGHRRGPLPDRADPPQHRLRALAVDRPARRGLDHRAAHVDEHARAGLRPDRSRTSSPPPRPARWPRSLSSDWRSARMPNRRRRTSRLWTRSRPVASRPGWAR